MPINHSTKILILAPHTDDGELGCGGSISRFIDNHSEVFYATFSWAEDSVPDGLPKDILLTEVREATETLGIDDAHLMIFDYPVRKFSDHRQEILEDLVTLNRDIHPDIVFMPAQNDLHQDHGVIVNEGLRAFRYTSIFGYELPRNNITFDTTAFIRLEEHHVITKIEALKCYESQKSKRYFDPKFIRGLAKTRGVQIDTDYAEAFTALRWVL